MSSSAPVAASPSLPSPPLRPPGRVGRIFWAILLSVLFVLAGFGVYTFWKASTREPTLVIYTYTSLLGGGCGSASYAPVFGAFGAAHGVRITVECPGDTLVNTLVAQKNAPQADLVIGLDEITGPQAEAAGVLVPYVSPQLAHVPGELVAELSPDHAVTPYEYGFLGIDYNTTNPLASNGAVQNSSFRSFERNASWSSGLLIENPTVDIVGEEFLAWQVEFYQQVLHLDWTGFWRAVDPHLPTPALSWDQAFGAFTAGPGSPPFVASFTTDPAYAAYSGTPGAYNSTTANWNGTAYGWRTIYGVGIVQGTTHLGLDEQFIDWFLSASVQSLLPTSEWEYPANSTIPLPSVYGAAPSPGRIVALNNGTTPAELVQQLPAWLDEWTVLENQYGPR